MNHRNALIHEQIYLFAPACFWRKAPGLADPITIGSPEMRHD
jgi:hypothetical protein